LKKKNEFMLRCKYLSFSGNGSTLKVEENSKGERKVEE
jgi:hypothetical protein